MSDKNVRAISCVLNSLQSTYVLYKHMTNPPCCQGSGSVAFALSGETGTYEAPVKTGVPTLYLHICLVEKKFNLVS